MTDDRDGRRAAAGPVGGTGFEISDADFAAWLGGKIGRTIALDSALAHDLNVYGDDLELLLLALEREHGVRLGQMPEIRPLLNEGARFVWLRRWLGLGDPWDKAPRITGRDLLESLRAGHLGRI